MSRNSSFSFFNKNFLLLGENSFNFYITFKCLFNYFLFTFEFKGSKLTLFDFFFQLQSFLFLQNSFFLRSSDTFKMFIYLQHLFSIFDLSFQCLLLFLLYCKIKLFIYIIHMLFMSFIFFIQNQFFFLLNLFDLFVTFNGRLFRVSRSFTYISIISN